MKYFIDKKKSKIEIDYTLPNSCVDVKDINIKGVFKTDKKLLVKTTHFFKDKEKQVSVVLPENIIGTVPIENRKYGFGYSEYFDKTIIEIFDCSVFVGDDYLIEFDVFETNGVVPSDFDLLYNFIKTLDSETILKFKVWMDLNSLPVCDDQDVLLDKFLHLNKLAFNCFSSNDFKGLFKYNAINETNCKNNNDILKDIFNNLITPINFSV